MVGGLAGEVAIWAPDLTAMLANPYVAFGLRAALGLYVIYMARGFYADPFGYFRRWMPQVPEFAWARKTVRALACFCVWGGCFIFASAIAAQILDLHGYGYALLLVLLAVVTTYFLLPAPVDPGLPNARSGVKSNRPVD